MAGVEVKIDGLEELSRRMKLIADNKTAKRIARKAARKAMNIVRDAARQNAKMLDDPKTSEKIWKNISTQAGKSRDRNAVVMRVGVRGGARIPYTNNDDNRRAGRLGQSYQLEGSTWYWRLVEFGRGSVSVGKKTKVLTDGENFFGKNVGPASAKPFMRPALYNNINNITDKFAQVFNEELDKELLK